MVPAPVKKKHAREHLSCVLSAGLIGTGTVLPYLTEVMVSDRMAANESLALGHTAAFNKSRCVFLGEKNQTISLEFCSVYTKADSQTAHNSKVLFPVVKHG